MASSSSYSLGYAEGTDIPIERLSYDYVKDCKDGGELEKILKILRSGKEGVYPDLIKTTEEHLRRIKPNSKLLIKAQNFTKVTDLPHEEWKTVNSDLQQWEQIISREEDSLTTRNKQQEKDIVPPTSDLPPVRKGGVVSGQKQSPNDVKPPPSAGKGDNPDRIKSYDFKAWDKYDPDKEMKKVEETSNKQENGPTSNGIQWNKELTEKEKAMSEIERQKVAQREREKGNEAFRAGDHDEAMAYYSRSIKLFPDSAAYNNRALVCIKMKKYEQAMTDCKEALKRDPDNPKALLRCATACDALKDYHEAVEMCERLLRIEPNNKRCQELLSKVRQSYVPDTSRDSNRKPKGKRLTIEEVDEKGNTKSTTPTINQSSPGNDSSFVCNTGEVSERSSAQTTTNPSTTPPQSATPMTVAPPTPLPMNVQFLKDKGNELFRVGQYATALVKYTSAIEELEKSKGDHTQSLSTLYGNRAACSLKNGDCRSCINDSSKAIDLSPSNIKAIMRRAMAYETMEKYRNAFIDYQLILRVDPRFEKVQQSLSRLTPLLRDQDGNKWREKLPLNPDEHRVLTAFYSNSSADHPPATNQPKQDTPPNPTSSPTVDIQPSTIQQSTQSANSTTSTGTTTGTTITASTGTTTGTTSTASTGTTSTESTGTTSTVNTGTSNKGSTFKLTDQEKFEEFRLKGNQFVKQGDYMSALPLYSSCIDVCPSVVAGYTNRALCYLKMDQYDNCDKDCSHALELEPKNVKALYRRALARKEIKKFQESLKDLKLVIELDPKNTAAKKEKEFVHDLYLKELRQLQATGATQQPTEKESKTSKKVGGASTKQPTTKKSTNGKKDSKSRNSVSPTPAPPTTVAGATTENTKKGAEKKRKKVLVEEVTDEDVGTREQRKEAEPKQERERVVNAPEPEINLHDIKAEEANVGTLIQQWNSVPRNATPLHYAQLLLKINPSLLEQVISNKLEGYTLSNIIAAVNQYLVPEGFHKFSFNVLYVLSRVSRFNFIKMFLSAEEKKVLRDVFDKFGEAGCIDQDKLIHLRGKYSL